MHSTRSGAPAQTRLAAAVEARVHAAPTGPDTLKLHDPIECRGATLNSFLAISAIPRVPWRLVSAHRSWEVEGFVRAGAPHCPASTGLGWVAAVYRV